MEVQDDLKPSPWLVSLGTKQKLENESYHMLEQFRDKLFQHIVNPDKVDKDTIERTLQAWKTTRDKLEYQDNKEMQQYMQKVHLPRQAFRTEYEEHKQALQQLWFNVQNATIMEKESKRKQFISATHTFASKYMSTFSEKVPYNEVYTTEP